MAPRGQRLVKSIPGMSRAARSEAAGRSCQTTSLNLNKLQEPRFIMGLLRLHWRSIMHYSHYSYIKIRRNETNQIFGNKQTNKRKMNNFIKDLHVNLLSQYR